MPVSAQYLAVLPQSHQIATRAELWSGDTFLRTVRLEDQTTVTIDRDAAIRRTCSVFTTDTGSDLNVYGNELHLSRGVTYADGTTELAPVGVFGLEDVLGRDTAPDNMRTLNGQDRSRRIQASGFTDTYVIPPVSNVGVAILQLCQSRWKGIAPLQYNFTPTTAVTQNAPTVYKPGDDPWKEAKQLAAACGYDLFFDATGSLTFRPVLDPTTQQVSWSYDEGALNIATEYLPHQSRQTAPNYIIRDGMGSGVATPVRGLAYDSNPASPTYYLGSYGLQPDYQGSSLYATQPQADAAAKAALLLALGSIEQLTVWAADPRADHDIDDVIEVTRARSNIAPATRYVIDTILMRFGTVGVTELTGRKVNWA